MRRFSLKPASFTRGINPLLTFSKLGGIIPLLLSYLSKVHYFAMASVLLLKSQFAHDGQMIRKESKCCAHSPSP